MEDNPSAISHVSLGTNDFSSATAFYDSVLSTLGIHRVMEHAGEAVAYGRAYPEFWVVVPLNDQPATLGNGTHFGFLATSAASVDAFYEAAVAAGAREAGAPGPREEYGAPYYGCFVHDLDGHKIEAAFWDVSKE